MSLFIIVPKVNLSILSDLKLYVFQKVFFSGKRSDIFLELAVVHKVGEVIGIREIWKAHHLFGRVGEDRLVDAGSAILGMLL